MSHICVATSEARAYYELVSRLKSADLPFSSVVPGTDPQCDLVLTTEQESANYGGKALVIERLAKDPGIFKAQVLSRLGGQEDVLLVGVDPGKRTGLAIFYGRTKLAFGTFGSPGKVCARIAEFAEAMPGSRLLIRIGNGNLALAAELAEGVAESAPSAQVELVDESGTSVRTSTMKGVQRDQVAAAKIAFRKGHLVTPRPRTPG